MSDKQAQPWWKFGHAWLVFGGPAVVVLASFVTLYLAISSPDPVINTEPRAQRSSVVKPETGTASGAHLAPAMQARNHAATGVPPPSKP
ncbi:hypothetical protein SAMN05216344_11161 [Polaromonas sp. OV174]|uniref:nitrogen fixation protein FixH n=1 Tax=Polaromonas sp. OV174 TaxID=1855300 RepID=UPI0008DEAC36|nr:nitrogen fixation protein FixH [Polaromonas sp. OV174]SFC20754.1 hypothetical protein SAMN05216344_11161 [Polaromonas sp. OV174]